MRRPIFDSGRSLRRAACVLLFYVILPVAAKECEVHFSPMPGVAVKLYVKDQNVDLQVTAGESVKHERVTVETEKPLKVAIDDYNFDSYKDFSFSHTDDGMGVFDVTTIYVYSEKDGRFVLMAPDCGDEFINLRIVKEKRMLINSYVEDNRYKTCRMRF